ncbi:MAG: hypothetical protein C5B53_06000 [Candidatus Melainabacteria bacterium]|nr:MAG: hypothetical protein C5B53_06000 [Candidatus Melainabacteria bacterium]
MNEEAQFRKESAVRFERNFPGPINRVWEFLVDTKKLPAWFGDSVIEPRMGGAVKFMDGHVRGVITQWYPPRRLTYTWNVFAPGQEESDYPESYVSFKLQEQGKEVRLILDHLPVLERFEKQNAMGWHTFLDMLAASVSGKTVESREFYMKQNAARYGINLANLVR